MSTIRKGSINSRYTPQAVNHLQETESTVNWMVIIIRLIFIACMVAGAYGLWIFLG